MRYLIANSGNGFTLAAIKNDLVIKVVTYALDEDRNPTDVENLLDFQFPINERLANCNISTWFEVSLDKVNSMLKFVEKQGMLKHINKKELISEKPKTTYGTRTYLAKPAVVKYSHYKAIVNKIIK
jgi:hypothetical protein